MRQTDKIIYTLDCGKMTRVGDPRSPETKTNFLIVCDHGDWSGFGTLAECEKQFSEIESNGKPNGFYRVVERF